MKTLAHAAIVALTLVLRASRALGDPRESGIVIGVWFLGLDSMVAGSFYLRSGGEVRW